MADIQPFVATRYADQYADKLALLLTPPYDVISPEMQEELHARHPKNFVAIDLARDKDGEDRYARAARHWNEWREAGTLVADPRPAIYAYEQEFELPGRGRRKRRGIFAAVRIEDFGSEGGIRAHEHTFAGPKADRLNLMRATDANMSPIFCVYDDAAREADKVVEMEVRGRAPVQAEIDGIVHRLWAIDHPPAVRAIVEAMRTRALYIADGHHRYETSLNYRNERRAATGLSDGNQPFDRTLMFLANIHDEGLEILPTHRVFSNEALAGVDLDAAVARLGEAFEASEVAVDLADPARAAEVLGSVLEQSGAEAVSYVLLRPGRAPLLLKLRADANPDALIPEPALHPALKALDVTLLHRYIAHRVLLGAPATELDDSQVAYVKDAADAIRLVAKGGHAAGFLLNATKIPQVVQIAGLGMRMPHKSTYFHPKIITGLVIRDLSIQR